MAGMDHFRAALIIAAGETAKASVLAVEHLWGHAHGATHAALAEAAAEAACGPLVDASLATWLAALDARYAAGAHAGPVIARANLSAAVGVPSKDMAMAILRLLEAQHGRVDRGLAHSLSDSEAARTATEAAIAAELDLFLADIDARYAAGACAAPQAGVMDGGVAAIVAMASAASQALVVLESGHGHGAHFVSHANAIVALGAADWAEEDAATNLAFVLNTWDARYQVHA